MTFLNANIDNYSKSYIKNNKPVNIAQVLILNLSISLKKYTEPLFLSLRKLSDYYYQRSVKPVLLHLSLFTSSNYTCFIMYD